MDTDRLQRTLIILLTLAVLTFLVEKALEVGAIFGNTILLFALAWLVAFIVAPLVQSLTQAGLPTAVVRWAEPHFAPETAHRLASLRLSRGWATLLIYLGVIVVLVIGALFVAPVAASQLYQLGSGLPEYANRLPGLIATYQRELNRLGLEVKLSSVLSSPDLVQGAQNFGALIVQNALGIATGLANLVVNLFIVLILSFYMALDGPKLVQRAIQLTPAEWQDEATLFAQVVGRTFGGFVRGQLLQALLFSLGTAAVMIVAGVNFVLLISLIVGLLMLIPAIGPILALLPPVLLAVFQQPGTTLWVFLVLLIFQQVIINVVMPRLMSQMIGLHPLLVFAAILVGVRIAGIWGSLFGIPVAGVLASILMFFYVRLLETGHLSGGPVESVAQQAKANPPPQGRPAKDDQADQAQRPIPIPSDLARIDPTEEA
jgi:predicted PurR-regulated permease PerM